MSREIKFRAWDEESKEMISGDDLAFEEYDLLKNWLSQDGIMQYTGLRDSKRNEQYPDGQEIYEGDILEPDPKGYEPLRFVVSWGENNCWVVYIQHFPYEKESHRGYWFMSNLILDSVKVIGNIYEDSELLEKKS